MQARFLLGPTGSGKTFRCAADARAALKGSPDGPPLLFLAPKQATFQLERQLLSDPTLAGYTRLRILSFERLAEFILTETTNDPPDLLSGEGRLMVLRALLSRSRDKLKLFRATARLRGFAQQLSISLRELQHAQLSPERLLSLSRQPGLPNQLDFKLQDLATMLKAYLSWLQEHRLQDEDHLAGLATQALTATPRPTLHFAELWFDGFAELTPCEMDFLAAFLPFCGKATLAFNLDRESARPVSWLSIWAGVGETYGTLRDRLSGRDDIEVGVEWLDPQSEQTRFASNPVLRHLERNWSNPQPFAEAQGVEDAIRFVVCANPDAEATVAAREIRRFVRGGGQFRQAGVIVRNLERYFDPIRRVFSAFDIPFFLDRREPVGHHPLSELTQNALRTVAFQWQPDDWFGALKTGLAHDVESDIDDLENEALARGWKGDDWLRPLNIPDNPALLERLEPLRAKLVAPFEQLAADLRTHPSGPDLAAALASFWTRAGVADRLQAWSVQPAVKGASETAGLVHATLWTQMQDWLDNLAMAFAHETLSLREWVPILEAGLASQTVGVIPPTLDQVLVGAVDRSRNPDLKLALVLGMNESVFPAVPEEPNLLNSADRERLISLGVNLTATTRRQLARERYFGYIACTRARQRLVITCAARDADDKALNPSPFADHVLRLFPTLSAETFDASRPWFESEHVCELMSGALNLEDRCALFGELATLPAIAKLQQQLVDFRASAANPSLSPTLAECLYGPVLQTSVSRLEEYASCPFRFAVISGLRAEERQLFQLDVRRQGSFQHEVLARFHQQLIRDNRRWHDLKPSEARDQIRSIAEKLVPEYDHGVLESSEQARYTARALTKSLEEFIAAVIEWMPQYDFEPAAVELAFGIEEKPLPAWDVDLGEGHKLSFRGKIDRIDLCRDPETGDALCVVIDYKSSARKLDPVLVAHGIQLQLLAYLNVLGALERPDTVLGARRLIPAGVFFVNLRGRYSAAKSRTQAFNTAKAARALAYQHTGRFDVSALPRLDNRLDIHAGDQFNYRLRNDGQVHGNCREALDAAKLQALLDSVAGHLKRMGCEIFAGKITMDPYRKGAATPCDKCVYQSVCRIDPWTHQYRSLEMDEKLKAER